MTRLRQLCEQIRSEVDKIGAKGCYSKLVYKYNKLLKLPDEGLWAAIDYHLQDADPEKTVKQMVKVYGGSPRSWLRWLVVISKNSGCPKYPNKL